MVRSKVKTNEKEINNENEKGKSKKIQMETENKKKNKKGNKCVKKTLEMMTKWLQKCDVTLLSSNLACCWQCFVVFLSVLKKTISASSGLTTAY